MSPQSKEQYKAVMGFIQNRTFDKVSGSSISYLGIQSPYLGIQSPYLDIQSPYLDIQSPYQILKCHYRQFTLQSTYP